MTFQQEGDEKPCLSPAMGYPSPGVSPSTMSPLHSGYHNHPRGYPNPHHHYQFHPQHPMTPGKQPPPSPAYFIATQLAHHPEREKSYSLAGIMLCLLLVLILGISLTSFLVWEVFGHHGPTFEVQTFSSPIFHIDNTSLNASFEASIKVSNPSDKLTLTFSNIESRLIYKGLLVDTSMVDPINVGKISQDMMITKFKVPSTYYDSNKSLFLKSMGKDHENGSIFFSVTFSMVAKMSSGYIWKRRNKMVVFCEDLLYEFDRHGGGNFNSYKRYCSITT